MKINSIYIIIIIILVGYSIFVTTMNYRMKDTNNKYRNYLKKKNIEDSTELANIKTHISFLYTLREFNNFADTLISKYNIEDKLVFYFRYEHCGSCVTEILADIDSMIASENVDYSDLVLIGQNTVDNPFRYEIMEKYSNKFQTIWISSEEYFKPLAKWPYFFIARKGTAFNYLYIPELMPMFEETYYYEIIPGQLS